jgi:acyl-coenzyme A synthetase/AMP-(fatty) acid ligase
VAFVIRTMPVEAKELVHHCRRELAPYKIPTKFNFVDSLPRNANGKVVKGELLALLEDTSAGRQPVRA